MCQIHIENKFTTSTTIKDRFSLNDFNLIFNLFCLVSLSGHSKSLENKTSQRQEKAKSEYSVIGQKGPFLALLKCPTGFITGYLSA